MDFHTLSYSLLAILNQMSPYILLGFILAGLLHVFVRPSTMTRHLSGKGWKPVVKAALLGIPLPLCSCGVLPTAVGLRRRGASSSAATSFLIATPQTGVDSIAATYSLLGLPFALIRPLAALVGAVGGGMAVDKIAGNEFTVDDNSLQSDDNDSIPATLSGKIAEALRYGLVDMVGNMGKWLVIGLVVAALITVFVPDSLFVGLSRYPLLAMLAVVAVAIPMYICATGSIPIALSLMAKGLSPGIAFVMLMAGPAANFASIVILGRAMGRKATIVYIASVVVTAIAFGLAIDLLLPRQWFAMTGAYHAACHGAHAAISWFDTACSALLIALLIYSAIKNHRKTPATITAMTKTYKIEGMNCQHCAASVRNAISAVDGVENVTVDLGAKQAIVEGSANTDNIAQAVRMAGFEFVG